jgi:hypothetical protein
MKCTRCGLINPPSALRCDCGYDFATQTVEAPFLAVGVPKEMRYFRWLLYLYAFGILVRVYEAFTASPPQEVAPVLVGVAHLTIVLLSYFALLRRNGRARILLMVITFPLGTLLLGSSAVKIYCLQKPKTEQPQ